MLAISAENEQSAYAQQTQQTVDNTQQTTDTAPRAKCTLYNQIQTDFVLVHFVWVYAKYMNESQSGMYHTSHIHAEKREGTRMGVMCSWMRVSGWVAKRRKKEKKRVGIKEGDEGGKARTDPLSILALAHSLTLSHSLGFRESERMRVRE